MSKIDGVGAALQPAITQVMHRVPPRDMPPSRLPGEADLGVPLLVAPEKPERTTLPPNWIPATWEQRAARRTEQAQWPLRKHDESPAPPAAPQRFDAYL